MPDSWDSFIDSLVEDTTPIQIKPARNERQFPCGQCAGTGLYQGVRVHQEKKQCFACRGKGYFKTDPRKLQKQREQRATKREQVKQDAREANLAHEGVLDKLSSMASWNDFARSMVEQHQEGRAWSEKQVTAALSMIDKIENRREQLAVEREQQATALDLSPINKMFTHAQENGYKRPVYRAEGLTISLAPINGANVGALYVKDFQTKEYIGKVKDGKFYGAAAATDAYREALLAIAIDPRAAAIRFGQQTGSCSCCGRTLTNKTSIDLGIGPICASKWNLI